jgi:hypothetical protein
MKYSAIPFLILTALLANYWENTSISFGQEGKDQGLVRCSAGNLVRSFTECPSTDLCPPSERLGTEVHCTVRQPTNISSSTESNIKEREAVAISTSKPTYKPGEIVNITIMNIGKDPITFSNSILGLKIENAATHEKYPLFSAQVITVLDSDGVKSLKWNQRDSFGHQVGEGNYTASTSTGSLTANTTFSIK